MEAMPSSRPVMKLKKMMAIWALLWLEKTKLEQ
jgi:hypothetical protein